MEKLTVLVKGNICYKDYGCATWVDNVIAEVDYNDYPNPSLIIEGDLNIDNFALLDEGIRLVATGLIHMRGLGVTPSVKTCNELSYLSSKYISAKGTFNG